MRIRFNKNWPLFWSQSILISMLPWIFSLRIWINCISRIRFISSFFWPWQNQYLVHGFDFISISQFLVMICSVSAEGCLYRVPTRFRSLFFWLWVNHFCFFFVCIWSLFSIQFSLVILGQISAACSESRYRKLEFCITLFWF